jgi:hypothetical protein
MGHMKVLEFILGYGLRPIPTLLPGIHDFKYFEYGDGGVM